MNLNLNKEPYIEALLLEAYEQRGQDLQKSIELADEALLLSRKLQDTKLTGKSLNRLALFHMIRGAHQNSLDMSLEAIQCFKDLDDDLGIADAKYNIAGIYYKTNNYHLGMVYLIDCLTIYRKHNDKHNESRTQKSLGAVYEFLGDQSNAMEAYEGAISAALDAKNKNLESNAYNPLSGILLKVNKTQEALQMIEQSIAIKTKTGDTRGLAFALYGRGKVYTHLKEFEKAEKDLFEALSIHQSFEEHLGTAMAYNKIAALWLAMGKTHEAKEMWAKAISFSEENNISLILCKSCHSLYKLFRSLKNDTESLKYLEKFIKEKEAAISSQTVKVIENYELINRMKSAEREADLQRERAEMILRQEKMEHAAAMKQEFLSAMSHEIRTPLNAVTSIISLLQDRADQSEKKLLTSLRFSSKNLLRIINDILDFSKLDSNKMTLEKHPVAFKEFIYNIKETYVSLAMEKGLTLDVHIDSGSGEFYQFDETKVFQILGNLVSNAIKYTEKGGAKIDVSILETAKNHDVLRFSVEDTGIGIAEKEMARLFDSFYMPKSITTRNTDGTGLGLTIVKKLIELHGSTIQIESTEGKGSNFFFKLSLEKSNAPIKVDPELVGKLQNKTAILAEDNEINAMVMRELLLKWGVSIKRVKNGEEAVNAASEGLVDFILMDIHMPQMNGFDATKIIRSTENPNQLTPIFALTADITAVNQEEFSTYFNGFLWKPLQIERLFQALLHIDKETHPFYDIPDKITNVQS